jgi:Ca2+-binding RTX toxin-like protein
VTETAFGHVDHVEDFELLQFGDGTTMNIGYELVSGGSGDDWLIGGLEDDLIATNGGDDFVYGLAGDDRIEISGVGDVVVDTGEGADEIVIAEDAQGSIEIITGGPGDSLIYEGSTDDIAFGYINDNGDLIVGTHDLEITITDQVSYDAGIGKYVVSGIDAIVVEQRGEDSDTDGPASGVFGSDHREGDLLYSNAVTDDNTVFAGAGADTIVIGSGNDVAAETSVYGDSYNFETDQTQNISYGDELRFAWAHEDVEITDRLDGFYEVEYVGVGEDAGKVVQFTDIEKLVFEGGANAPVEIQVIDGPVVGSAEWFADGNDWGGAAAGQEVSHGDNNVEFQIAGDTIKVYADISETITWTETETRTVKETYKDSRGRTKTRNVKKTFEVEKSEDVTHEGELIWQGSHNDISGFSFSDDEYVNVISVREFDIGGNAIEMTLGTEDTDLIFGTESDNVIFGAGGDDLIVGGGGNDTILGGSGEDAILGGMGDDLLLGDWDVDVLQDEFGLSEEEIAALLANQLNDGSNDDLVIGGDGIDEVDGGEGRNVVISGGTDLDINQDGDANIQDIEDLIGKDLFDDEHWV